MRFRYAKEGEMRSFFKRFIPAGVAILFLIAGMLKADVRFGLKAGMTVAEHWSMEEKGGEGYSVNSGSLSGLHGGLLALFRLSPHFHIQSEILFIKKGSSQDVTLDAVPIGTLSVAYSLNYLEIPVLLKTFFLSDEKAVSPYTAAGPYFSYLVDSRYEVNNAFLGRLEQDITGLKKTDVGVVFGTGLKVRGPKLHFSLNYRFSLGFIDLNLPTGPGFPSIALKNQGHMIFLEVYF